jgi:hypothetical protein
MMATTDRIDSIEAYRETLAEIRRLRSEGSRSEEHERLARLEAAAADYAERLRAADLEKGRPETT